MAVALDASPSENNGASTTPAANAITYAAGAVIVVTIQVAANRTVSGPTDTNGLTWTTITNNLSAAASSRIIYSWWAYAASGGTTTFSCTISGAGSPTWNMNRMSVTGVDSTSPIDATSNTTTGTGVTSPQNSTSSLTSVSDALIVAAWSSTSRTYSADTGNGFTIATSITPHPFQYKIGSVSAATIPFTWTTGTVTYAAIAFSLKAAATGSAAGPVFGRGRTFNNSRTLGGSTI